MKNERFNQQKLGRDLQKCGFKQQEFLISPGEGISPIDVGIYPSKIVVPVCSSTITGGSLMIHMGDLSMKTGDSTEAWP